MPKIKVKTKAGTFATVIDVWCKKCGTGLCKQSYGRKGKDSHNIIDVEPCQQCIDNAIKEHAKKLYEQEPNFVRDYIER